MSYTALYRKFRPDSFADVKGQDAIVTTLKNQIAADRIGHAYLFCGTRGTGKTTVAKILAKAVNCEHPVDGSPCGQCDTCKAIAAGTSMNVIEIDAASNNGVDNIREIRDEVSYSPTSGKYKVYIIDEVHMLSIGAFNALLKTLEEPPSYVIFILATTEAHKIPITILSRCQRYDFKRIALTTIADRLRELMDTEQVEAEDKALRYIAKKADGSMRDALSLLDQCIAFYLGQKLTYDHVLEVLGAVDTEEFGRLLREVQTRDVKRVIGHMEELVMQGRDLSQFVTDFTWYLRNLLLLQSSDHMEDVLDVSTENLQLLKEEAQMVEGGTLMRYIRIFSDLANQMKYASSKRVLLEVALIKLCRPQMETDTRSLAERIRVLEEKLENGIAVQAAPAAPQQPVRRDENKPERKPKEKVPAAPQDLQEVKRLWKSIVSEIGEARFRVTLSLAEPRFNPQGEDGRLYVMFDDFQGKTYMESEAYQEELESIIESKLGKRVEVKFVLPNEDTGVSGQLVKIDVDDALREFVHADIVYED